MAEIDSSEAQANQNAAWAERFKGSSTNLSQRRRYAEDLAKDTVNRDTRAAAQFDQRLAGDKGLRDLVFGREKAKLAERQFQFQQDKQAWTEQRQLDELDLKLRNEKRAMERDERERRNAMRIDDHTANFESQIQDMLDNGLVEGSPGYAAGLMQAIRNNPFARKDLRDIAIKGARIKGDPDAMNAFAEANGLEMSGFKVDPVTGEMEPTYARKRVEPKGDAVKNGSSAKPHPNEAQIRTLRKELTNLDPDNDEAKIIQKNQLIDSLTREMGGVRPGAGAVVGVPPGTPVKEAPKPKTVIQDGVTYNLQEDGTYQ